MKYCINCGQKLPDFANFCPICGQKQFPVTEEEVQEEEKVIVEKQLVVKETPTVEETPIQEQKEAQDDVAVEVISDIRIALHDGVESVPMDTRSFTSK